jgi:hypothetical protein
MERVSTAVMSTRHDGSRQIAWRLSALTLTLFAVACDSSVFPFGSPVPPLANTQASAAALARAVLDGFEHRDLAVLRALAVDEQEFRDHVWPDLPSARPERNLPFSYVWGDLHQKSDAALARTLATHGGQHYELISVQFLGGKTQYNTYVVHRETLLTVKGTTDSELRVRLFGATLEKDGRFKVFSYVVDQ